MQVLGNECVLILNDVCYLLLGPKNGLELFGLVLSGQMGSQSQGGIFKVFSGILENILVI